jgi:hypothetical protein
MFYEEIFRKLKEAQVNYLIAGGLAVNLHGVPRMTQDLDLLIDLSETNLMKIIKALTELGYRARIPEDPYLFANPDIRARWIQEKHMKVFTFIHKDLPYQEIDLMFEVPVSYQEAVKRAVIKKAGDLVLPLVSIPDLIKLKAIVGRKHDLYDIRLLKEILKLEEQDEPTGKN